MEPFYSYIHKNKNEESPTGGIDVTQSSDRAYHDPTATGTPCYFLAGPEVLGLAFDFKPWYGTVR